MMKFIKLYESFHTEYKLIKDKFDKESKELSIKHKKELEDCLVPLVDYGFRVKINSLPDYDIDYFYVIASINYNIEDLEEIYSLLKRQFHNIKIELDSYPEFDKIHFFSEGRRGCFYCPINQTYYHKSLHKNLLDKFELLLTDPNAQANIKNYVEMEITFSVL